MSLCHASLEVGRGFVEDAGEMVCVQEVVVNSFLNIRVLGRMEARFFVCSKGKGEGEKVS